MRNITGSKAHPAKGAARVYVDGTTAAANLR